MKLGRRSARVVQFLALGVMAFAGRANLSGAPKLSSCEKIVLAGEVSAGQEWKASFGQGWVFRLLPIQPGRLVYSGWDLVVDREHPAGFPDALLLATPPYNSINEREVGTTYGLRAQDAIGWNPRSFRFLLRPADLKEGQKLYFSMGSTTSRNTAQNQTLALSPAMRNLMGLERQSAAGQLRILDARLAPGAADAAPYAENWALQSARTTHSNEVPTGGQPSTLGELHWMRFSITLWLPDGWKAPATVHAVRAACSE
jgi:hypothetical protein